MGDSTTEMSTNEEIIDILVRKVTELEKQVQHMLDSPAMDFEQFKLLLVQFAGSVNDLNQQNSRNLTLNTKVIQDSIAQSFALQNALKAVEIPKEITATTRHTYEHKHFNGGVRFMLITLIAIILTATCISVYFYGKYSQIKGYGENYETYKKNSEWEGAYFDYMYRRHVKDSQNYIKTHPFPQ